MLETEEERDAAARRARRQRGLPRVLPAEEREQLVVDREYREARFLEAILVVIRAWTELAEERLRPAGHRVRDQPRKRRRPGGRPGAAGVVRGCRFAEDDVYDLNGVEVVSWGWSNRTPWHSPREQDEDALEASIMAAAAKARDPEHALFNLHCPPYDSGLDIAPAVTR